MSFTWSVMSWAMMVWAGVQKSVGVRPARAAGPRPPLPDEPADPPRPALHPPPLRAAEPVRRGDLAAGLGRVPVEGHPLDELVRVEEADGPPRERERPAAEGPPLGAPPEEGVDLVVERGVRRAEGARGGRLAAAAPAPQGRAGQRRAGGARPRPPPPDLGPEPRRALRLEPPHLPRRQGLGDPVVVPVPAPVEGDARDELPRVERPGRPPVAPGEREQRPRRRPRREGRGEEGVDPRVVLVVLPPLRRGSARRPPAVGAGDPDGRATPADAAVWNGFAAAFGVPERSAVVREIAAMRGSFGEAVAWRWQHAPSPLTLLPVVAPDTLGAMLLGMAGLRSGFVTGRWSRAAYARVALACLPLSLIGYAAIGWHTMATGFDQRWVYTGSLVLSLPLRMIGYTGYAALIVLLSRSSGAWSARIVAVGRMAFSNYLGTTLLMDLLFNGWGLGQFGAISRAWLYALVPPVWAVMLIWSPAWLARYRYGPLEWVWRSLVRGRAVALRA